MFSSTGCDTWSGVTTRSVSCYPQNKSTMPLTEDTFAFISSMLRTAHVASANKMNYNRKAVVN